MDTTVATKKVSHLPQTQWKITLGALRDFYQETKRNEVLMAYEWLYEGLKNMMRKPDILLNPKPNPKKKASVSEISDKARGLAFTIMDLPIDYGSGADARKVLLSKNLAYQYLLEVTFALEPAISPTKTKKNKIHRRYE